MCIYHNQLSVSSSVMGFLLPGDKVVQKIREWKITVLLVQVLKNPARNIPDNPGIYIEKFSVVPTSHPRKL